MHKWLLLIALISGFAYGQDCSLPGPNACRGVAVPTSACLPGWIYTQVIPGAGNSLWACTGNPPAWVNQGGSGSGTVQAGTQFSLGFYPNSGSNALVGPSTITGDASGNLTAPQAISSSASKYKNRSDVIDVYADLGCDITGVTDCTAALNAAITAHPNGTFLFSVPQSATSATYLLAGSANLTIPKTVTLSFGNGAQIATGTQAASNIASISRQTSSTQQTISLAGSTSSATTTTETFSGLSGLTLVGGQIISISGVTHAHACINCVVVASGTNSTQFTIAIASTAVAPGTETGGSATYYPGSITQLSLSTPLAGVTAGQSTGYIVCTGTTNYNSPYKIYKVGDTQDVALYDGRPGIATETAGSCYVPYQLTVLGSVQAGPARQIVAPNSYVTFQSAPTIPVGWYGAVGDGTTNDWLAFQDAMIWNPGGDILAAKTSGPTFNGGAAVTSYKINDELQYYGNSQNLHGNVGNTWPGGVALKFPQLGGPAIAMPPICYGCKIENLEVDGPACWNSTVLTTYVAQPSGVGIGSDGILMTGGEPRFRNIIAECFQRDGIHIDGTYAPYNQSVWGLGTPDYWHGTDIQVTDNEGYGIACWGHDCNGGILDGANDLKSNEYGGMAAFAEAPPEVHIKGENNSDNSLSAGTTDNIGTISCSAGVVSVTPATTFGHNQSIHNTWVTVAGSGVGDGTFQVTSANSANPLTYNDASCSGSASTGTIQTASTANVFAYFNTLPSGYISQNLLVGGMLSGDATIIEPYCEGTNGNPGWGNSTIIGGSICSSFNVNANSLASMLYGDSGAWFMQATSLNLSNPLSTGNALIQINSQDSVGIIGLSLQRLGTSNYFFEEEGSNQLSIIDNADAFQRVFAVIPGGDTKLTSGPSTGALDFQYNSTGPVHFFPQIVGGDTVTVNPTTPSLVTRLGSNLTGTTSPLQLNGSAGTSGQVLTSAGPGATPTWASVGGNGTVSYTTSQTASSSDNGKLVQMNCSSACSYTLPNPQPSSTFQVTLQSIGSSTATVVLGSSMTFNGGASVPVLNKYRTVGIRANTSTSTDYIGDAPLVAGTNVTFTPAANGLTIAASGSQTIAAGTFTLPTTAIGSGACSSAVTPTVTSGAIANVLATDAMAVSFNADPTATTGYAPTTGGTLYIYNYVGAGSANVKVCNNSSGSITPGAATLNFRVTR